MKIARDVVKNEKEPYQMAAYQVILRKLLDEEKNDSSKEVIVIKKSGSKGGNKPEFKRDNEFNEIMEKIDVDKLTRIKDLDSMLDKCLVLLDYINDVWPHNEGLLIEQIRDIFIDRIGLTTITNDAIRMALVRSAGKYVTRKNISVGKDEKYKYKILTAGKDYVKTLSTKAKK